MASLAGITSAVTMLGGCARDSSAQEQIDEALVATVEQRTLSEAITVRGEVTGAHRAKISVPGERGYVTDVRVASGDRIGAGSVPLEVNGRPVLLFEAPFPPWRDLELGDEGPDVEAVESGLDVVSDGVWEGEDIDALQGLLDGRGYELPTPDAAQQRLEEARHTVEDRRVEVDRAAEALDRAQEDDEASEEEAERQLDDAQRALERAEEELARARRAATPTLPLGWYTFTPALPGEVVHVDGVGAPAQETVLRLQSPTLVFSGTAPSAAADKLRKGDRATVEAGEWRGTGTISAATTVDQGSGPTSDVQTRVTVQLSDQPPDRVAGRSALAKVTLRSSSGEVLAVPVAAVWTAADGSTYVTPASTDEPVRVQVGETMGGWVELVRAGDLRAGDKVRTGVWLDDPESTSAG